MSTSWVRIGILILAGCVSGATSAADKPVDVRDLMTANQFHAAGLDKLSADQIAALNTWLAGYVHAPTLTTAATPQAAALPPALPAPSAAVPAVSTAATAKFGQAMLTPAERGEPDRIESRILGTFTGWNGKTVFKLENGQVWRQAATGNYDTHLENPMVIIKRLGLGYLLTIPGQGGTVFVSRIQ